MTLENSTKSSVNTRLEVAKIGGVSQGTRTDLEQNNISHNCDESSQPLQNSAKAGINTRQEVAKIGGVSHDTIARVKKIQNQFARRNLNAYQRSELALEMEFIFRAKARENQAHGKTAPNKTLLENSPKACINTRQEVAKMGGVSDNTIARVKKIQDLADDDTKDKLRRGEVSINAVYQHVKRQENKEKRANTNHENHPPIYVITDAFLKT